MASAANEGGTKTIEVSAPTLITASLTVPNCSNSFLEKFPTGSVVQTKVTMGKLI